MAGLHYTPSFFIKRKEAKKICPILYDILTECKVNQIRVEPRNHSKVYSPELNTTFHLNYL